MIISDVTSLLPGIPVNSPYRLNTYIGDTEGKIAILLEARDGLT